MRLRIGRKNLRTLYVQLGDEPSDADLPVGFAVDWYTAHAICTVANAPLMAPHDGSGSAEQRWEHLAEMARIANFINPPTAPMSEPGD